MNKALTWVLVVAAGLLAQGSASAQNTPSPRLTPAAVKRGWFENRRIMVEVKTDSAFMPTAQERRPGAPATFPFGEHFGVRIGNVVPVRINVFVLRPAEGERPILVDFNALKSGRLAIEPTDDMDFKLALPDVLPPGEVPVSMDEPKRITLRVGESDYDADMYEIRLYVQTFRAPQPMRFAVEFAYAAGTIENGGPDWKRVWTPEYIISMSRTADDGTDLSSGNTAYANQNPPALAGNALLALGILWIVTPIAFVGLRALRRHLSKERLLDPEEKAWRTIDPVLEKAQSEKGYAFSEAQVRTVVGAVLEYIGKPSIRSDQLASLQYEDDDGELLLSILKPLLAGVLEEGKTLSEERYAELVERIERLIPRP